MTVHCNHCGESLMGSVNRCWRCGRSIVVVAGEPELPPIRREPVELRTVPTASLGDEITPPAETEAKLSSELSGTSARDAATSPQTTSSAETMSKGTGAAKAASVTPVEPARRLPVQPKYPKTVFAESCAITSVVVGVLTAITSVVTAWSLIPAIVGIILGVVGLGSDRRKTAVVGIALCCLVVLISTGRISVWAYRVHERRQLEMMGEF